MKSKIYLTASAFFLLFSLIAKAQNTNYFQPRISTESNYSRIDTNAQGQVVLISGYKSSNVRMNSINEFEKKYLGTPFFKNGWYTGSFILSGGKSVEGLMAYDLVKNQVYYSQNTNSNAQTFRPDDFTINDTHFTKLKGEYSRAGDFYYEILADGNYLLLKQYTCDYKPTKTDVDNGYGSNANREFEGEYKKEEKLYLTYEGQLILVKNKKKFYRSLGELYSKAYGFSKEKKLNISKEDDAIALVEHLNKN
ncbi:hypothetical protein LAG90_04680 [Marinilongibacter aquaticus]|uniref:hypothetical protein n=1 Tax=Marinilongibacter aquaticus TaxID=2975157 RepID=UPI0021BDBDD6|nr:hypothetical protein [Marinilongibacter aquaticus]UBM59943.1 hypothetical protein LAG90_04680 [Marinilongibacter aquaticus]